MKGAKFDTYVRVVRRTMWEVVRRSGETFLKRHRWIRSSTLWTQHLLIGIFKQVCATPL
jgi:hypothetical protein